jgi:integrase
VSVYKVGSIYHFDFWQNGKRYKGSTRQTKADRARQYEAKEREEARNELLAPKVRDVPFKAFADEYLKLHVSQKRAQPFYRMRVDRFKERFGDKLLSEVGTREVARYQAERATQVSPASVNRDLAVLKSMFTKAAEWGNAASNPVKRVKFLREAGHRERFLTAEEAEDLLEKCSDWLRPLVTVAVHTGMRRGELLSLTWRDVDFRAGCIILDPERTKSGHGRKIPMNATVRSTLEALRAGAPVQGLDAPVFRGPDGGYPLMTLQRAFAEAVRKAGLLGFRFHDLRHSHASFLVQAGVPLNTVRDLLARIIRDS